MAANAVTESFRVILPGQPPSGNSMYERRPDRMGVRKREGVETYQAGVSHIVRTSRPSGWQATPLMVISYWFYLARDIDCTNAIKVIEDGIATALCKGNRPPYCCRAFDSRFLPRAIWKETHAAEPRVEVLIAPLV